MLIWRGELRLHKPQKATIIMEQLRKDLNPLPPLSTDPLIRGAGSDDFEPASVDDVVFTAAGIFELK